MFDFTCTKKPLVVFIPNYGRGDYIRKLVSQFKTSVPREYYQIVIGNDGIYENFDDLEEFNIKWFTLPRSNPTERNGCFIRNYFIKRCQSQYLFQKDPETLILSANLDLIYDAINIAFKYPQFLIKPRITSSLSRLTTEQLLSYPVKLENIIIDKEDMKFIALHSPERMHYWFGCPTKTLQEVGYSEKICLYGPEDQEMWWALEQRKIDVCTINYWNAVHCWHTINSSVFHGLSSMHQIFEDIKTGKIERNNEVWGNG